MQYKIGEFVVHEQVNLTQSFVFKAKDEAGGEVILLNAELWMLTVYVVVTKDDNFIGHFKINSKPFHIRDYTKEFQMRLSAKVGEKRVELVAKEGWTEYTKIPVVHEVEYCVA